MSIVRDTPLEVGVRTDWLRGMPRSIRVGGAQLAVVAVTRVRQERAAFNVVVGPRTRFEVQTATARLGLVFHHRDRRWVVDGMEPVQVDVDRPEPEMPLARAA